MIDPDRTADVLCREVLAGPVDVLVLQEADGETPPHPGILDIAQIEARSGLTYLHGDRAARWGAESHGFLGVILMAAPRVELEALTLLDLPGKCHRGAVIADIRKEGYPLSVVGTHLSLSQILRAAQMRTLGQHLFRREARPTVLCGDLNEWRPWGGLAFSRNMLGADFRGPTLRTFPVRRPLLPLDRVLAAGGARVVGARVLDGEGIRLASDHRPLIAEIAVGAPDP